MNKSDRKDIKFLDRPQVLTAGVLVSLAVIVAIVVHIDTYFEDILYFLQLVPLTE